MDCMYAVVSAVEQMLLLVTDDTLHENRDILQPGADLSTN